MSSNLHPISAFDIWADGTAKPAPDDGHIPAKGAAFRWLHVELDDPALPGWCAKHLPPLAARTLLAAKTRPRVDTHDDGLLLTLRGINLNDGAERADMVSLRLWVTPTLVVSVRRLQVFAMDDLHEQVVANNAPGSPVRMIARITEALVDRIEAASLDLEDQADTLEENAYEHTDKHGHKAGANLGKLRRTLIKLRRHLGPMSDALTLFASIKSPLIPNALRPRLRDTANRGSRSVDELNEVRERMMALTTHLDMEQSARLGRNGYVLSVIAAIFLPLGFITGLLGVNVAGVPGTAWPYAFWALCGGMMVLGLLLFVVLRWIKWF